MYADALISIILLTILSFLLAGPWQDLCTDFARQVIFEKRDRIFDMARRKTLSFESAEYRTIRSSLELSIRFAHELTIWRFLLMAIALRQRGELNRKSELRQALDRIENSEVRAEINRNIREANIALIWMVIAKSPLFAVLLLLYVIVRSMNGASQKLKREVIKVADVIQHEAEIAEINLLSA